MLQPAKGQAHHPDNSVSEPIHVRALPGFAAGELLQHGLHLYATVFINIVYTSLFTLVI